MPEAEEKSSNIPVGQDMEAGANESESQPLNLTPNPPTERATSREEGVSWPNTMEKVP